MKSYDEENHFYRIFGADIFETGDEGNNYFVKICGNCAWSIESCGRASGYSGGKDLFEINTRDLHLSVEVYSEEPGFEFQEHYLYKDGECIVNECVDWEEIYWDRADYKTFEEFKEDFDIEEGVTENDFDDEGYYHKGGFKEWDFSI